MWLPAPRCPSSIRWDSEILAHVRQPFDGFSMQLLVRRTPTVGELDLLAPAHVLSLPLAGARPLLDGRLDGAPASFAMDPGHALLRPAERRFQGVCRGAGTFRYVMLAIEPGLIERVTDGELEAATEVGDDVDIAGPTVVWAMRALAAQLERPSPGGRLQAEVLATSVLLELVRHRLVRDERYGGATGRTARELGRFADCVEAHLGEDLSLFRLAAEAGLSPAHLTRELKRVTGVAPHQYVLRRRAERARVLLARSHLAIGDVALAVGFSSQAHLNVVFRRVYGITPGEYRAGVLSDGPRHRR